MEDLSSQQDVITAAALIFFVLLAFIAFLYLNRKGKAASSGGPKTPNAKVVVPQGEQGTVFVKTEDGRAVRRSARQANKPVTPLAPKLAAAADDSTPKRTPSRKAAAAEPATTPRSTRRTRAA